MKKRGGGKTEKQKEVCQEQMIVAHQQYINIAQKYLDKAREKILQRSIWLICSEKFFPSLPSGRTLNF